MTNVSTVHLGERGELRFEQQMVDVTTCSPQPDPKWRFADAAGHEHAYDAQAKEYPTLRIVTEPAYWCGDCHDEHEDSHYECAQCGERIVPGTYVDPTRRFISGIRTITHNGEPITEAEAKVLAADVPMFKVAHMLPISQEILRDDVRTWTAEERAVAATEYREAKHRAERLYNRPHRRLGRWLGAHLARFAGRLGYEPEPEEDEDW